MTEQIPEGMKPWHGGEGPPDDYDKGLVFRRDGTFSPYSKYRNWGKCPEPGYETIAYTPKPAQPRIAPEVVERIRAAKTSAHLIAIVDQGCGGNLSFKEMAQSAMRQARDLEAALDEILAQIEPPVDPLEAEIREQLGDKFKHLAPLVAEAHRAELAKRTDAESV